MKNIKSQKATKKIFGKRILEAFTKNKKKKKVYIYMLQKTYEIYVLTETKQLQFMNPETPPLYEFLYSVPSPDLIISQYIQCVLTFPSLFFEIFINFSLLQCLNCFFFFFLQFSRYTWNPGH